MTPARAILDALLTFAVFGGLILAAAIDRPGIILLVCSIGIVLALMCALCAVLAPREMSGPTNGAGTAPDGGRPIRDVGEVDASRTEIGGVR